MNRKRDKALMNQSEKPGTKLPSGSPAVVGQTGVLASDKNSIDRFSRPGFDGVDETNDESFPASDPPSRSAFVGH